MNTFTIAGLVGLGVILFGILFAGLMMWLSRLVTVNQTKLEQEQTAYNPAVTLGHKVPVNADKEEQLRAARKEAARRAAITPRWANMRIGRKGAENTRPASKGLEEDPLTAVRIAAYHTWNGAKTGIPAPGTEQAAPTAAAAPVAVPTKKPEDLVPGKDYPFIEITDDMSPAETRSARIANAKARSAALKALKESAEAAPATAPAAAPASAPAQPAAPAVSVPEPDLIEITDDMSADEVRQARIANAKAQSAYKKALKEAEAAAPAAASAPAQPAAAPQQQAAAPAVSVPEPDLIEITDDMSADEVRQARIANAKAQSAYKKALKEAGATAAPAPQAATQAAAPQAAAQPATQAAPAEGDDAALASIPEPDLVEITDDMDPGDVRSARISNAKAISAYKKALKEAGIDPSTVEI